MPKGKGTYGHKKGRPKKKKSKKKQAFLSVPVSRGDRIEWLTLCVLIDEISQKDKIMSNAQEGENPQTPSSEELKLEEQALRDANPDEVRSQVIEKYEP